MEANNIKNFDKIHTQIKFKYPQLSVFVSDRLHLCLSGSVLQT